MVERSQDLAFAIKVLDAGCAPETKLRVTVTVPGGETPIVKSAEIDQIYPGEAKTVAVDGFGAVPLDKRIRIRVEVEPVPTEIVTENNSAEYPVSFAGGG